jgi:integrase
MSKRRRGRGEGAIYQRADGLWVAFVSLGHKEDGRRNRRFVYGGSKREAQEKLRKVQADYALGQLADPTNLTVEAWLLNWLCNTAKVKTSPTTYDRYEQLVRLHIIPHLGMLKLEKLSPLHVNNLFAKLEKGTQRS